MERLTLILFCVLACKSINCTFGQTYDSAVSSVAGFAAAASGDGDTVVPHYVGLPNAPGDGSDKFRNLLRQGLAMHNKEISARGNFSVSATLRTENAGTRNSPLRLTASVLDEWGHVVGSEATWEIRDGKDLAEIWGIPVHFGPEATPEARHGHLSDEYISDPLVGISEDRHILYTSADGEFGICAHIGDEDIIFQNKPNGDPFLSFPMGTAYTITLHNGTNHEVAVDLKIDGVNVFAFAADRHPDGRAYKYYVVKPNSQQKVIGWSMGNDRLQDFKTTPPGESAAALLGMPSEGMGLITAAFFASWTDDSNRPEDEPFLNRSVAVQVPVTRIQSREVQVTEMVPEERTKTEEYTIQSSGETRQRTTNYTVQVPQTRTKTESVPITQMVMEERMATGFGEERFVSQNRVERTIGVCRGVIAFRYE